MQQTKPVLVVALDGATWDVVCPWIEEGRLPHLASLRERGSFGVLESTVPPISPTAWATFLTGVNPGRHGVLDFTCAAGSRFIRRPASGAAIAGPTLLDCASAAGRRVLCLSLPMTYPPRPVNGVLVSGFPLPAGRPYTWPPDCGEALAARGFDLSTPATQSYGRRGWADFRTALVRGIRQRTGAALQLLEQERYDLAVVHYLETDKALHDFWEPMARGDEAFGSALREVFQEADAALGELLRAVGEEAHVLVLSDHGFGPCAGHVRLNTWLLERGYLRLRRRPATLLRRALYACGVTPRPFYLLLPERLKAALRRAVDRKYYRAAGEPGAAWRVPLSRLACLPFLGPADVDWARTRAFSCGSSGWGQIVINERGREAQGAVSPGAEKEQLLRELLADLEQLTDPESGEPVVERVWRTEELYRGPQLKEAPDLVLEYRQERYNDVGTLLFSSARAVDRDFISPGRAVHRREGLLVVAGPAAGRGRATGRTAGLADLAPTILYLLGLPVPAGLDGAVLEAYLSPEWLRERPVRPGPLPAAGGRADVPAEEQASMERMLQDMGYLR